MATDLMAWVDIETTGLKIKTDVVLEIGLVISNTDLDVLTGESWLVAHAYDVRANVDPVVEEMHTKSGLWDDLLGTGGLSWDRVQKLGIEFLMENGIGQGVEPMCGSTPEFDRKFLERSFPDLEGYFHYRSINVSSLKELAKKWGYPVFPSNPNKAHRPLQDLVNSIAELRFYRETMLRPVGVAMPRLGGPTL